MGVEEVDVVWAFLCITLGTQYHVSNTAHPTVSDTGQVARPSHPLHKTKVSTKAEPDLGRHSNAPHDIMVMEICGNALLFMSLDQHQHRPTLLYFQKATIHSIVIGFLYFYTYVALCKSNHNVSNFML